MSKKKSDFGGQKAISKHSGWNYFIHHHKVAFLSGLILSVWGLLSFLSIPKESAPYIPYGIATITTAYSGVSAEEIDSLITQKIENKIKNISNIRKIDSVSRNSASSITIEFEPDHNMIKGMADIRNKVDEAKPELPNDLENEPQVLEIDSAIEPFFSIILYGPYGKTELRDFAEELKLFLENVKDVAAVQISGGADREISVEVDPVKLQAFGLSVDEVVQSIRRSHIDTPIGDFQIGTEEYNIRFQGKHRNVEDVKNIELKNLSMDSKIAVIKISDIATVTEKGDENQDQIRRIGFPENGVLQNAISIQVSKGIGKNIFDVDQAVREEAIRYVRENFPADVNLTFELEVAKPAADSFENVYKSGSQAIVIVMLILFVFIGFRAGLVASLVIPITFLATIGVLALRGDTLNFMSNFSMILALGILVDTAVVIVEGIHYHIHKGFPPLEAAKMSLHEFKAPLISGTLTTLAVFIPLFSLPGVLGKYLTFIPITVFFVLTNALLISLLLIPAYGAQLMISNTVEKRRMAHHKFFGKIADTFRGHFVRIEAKALEKYDNFLRKILRKRWMRIGLFYGILLLFFLSFLIPIKFELFPSGDAFFFNVSVERPEGTISEETSDYSFPIEERLLEIPEIVHISSTIRGKQSSIYAELMPENERKRLNLRTSKAITDELQTELKEKFGDPTGSNIRVENAQNGPPAEFPVAFRVIADRNDVIQTAQEVARDLTKVLAEIPGTFGVKNDIEMIPGEFLYRIDRKKAIALDLDPDAVAGTIRTALKGSTAAVITHGNRDVDIVVRYDEKSRKNIQQISNIKILNRKGEYVLLRQVAVEQLTSGLSNIRRRDTRIAFTVSSLLDKNGNAAEITDEFLNRTAEYDLPEGIEVINAGENEENAELFAALGRAFVIAVLIMFLILVVQFNSYLQPLIILTTILFAQIGVSIGLFLTGTPRSLAFILGAISLAGIVVNDAIIMIDQMNKNNRRNAFPSLRDAIANAGKARLVPVILTTLTTSAGIIPLVFVDVFWAGLSYTIIFGLTVATFLTLVVTPAMYYQMEREKIITFVPLLALVTLGGTFALPGIFPKILFLLITVFLVWTVVKAYRRAKEE